MTTAQSETGRLTRVLIKHPHDAFVDETVIQAQWRDLSFTAAPDLGRAIEEFERLRDLLGKWGARIDFLPAADRVGLDSIYARDASVVCDRGVILCRMGKSQRDGEPSAQEAMFRALGIPILGSIQPPGLLEGGDVVWLSQRTVAVGRGYRTNAAGIHQLHDLLGDLIDEVIAVSLPHYRGPGDVFHLMSILSPVDHDLAVVYSPLMSVPFRQLLLSRGMSFIEVPDDEFETMGTNVFTIAPRKCLVVGGNPKTRTLLERAGVEVWEYEGTEISLKGGGGPTCLTRPIERDA
jgi:N-dimethylarginine dimethylaminohydrolase